MNFTPADTEQLTSERHAKGVESPVYNIHAPWSIQIAFSMLFKKCSSFWVRVHHVIVLLKSRHV